MLAYSINVLSTSSMNFNTTSLLERRELGVSVNGRFIHICKAAVVDSKELAERYGEYLTSRRQSSGDKEFSCEVISVQISGKNTEARITKDSDLVRKKIA